MRSLTLSKSTETAGPPATRIRVADGEVRVLDGPFTETKEVVGASFYKVRSIEEAKKWAARFMELHQCHWPGWEGEANSS